MLNYTQENENSIFRFSSDDISDAMDYLQNPSHFRPFHEGLSELLLRSGYMENSKSAQTQADYLYTRMKEIGSSIEKTTVLSWFLGRHRPKIEPASRTRMYEICFSLKLTMEQICWFFHHVYYDRCFNCHLMPEAVYYYCFYHGLSYDHAKRLIRAVQEEAEPETKRDMPSYTQYIMSRLRQFASDEELLHFLTAHKLMFESWNQSASREIKRLLQNCTGTPESLNRIYHMREQKQFYPNEIKNCGLIFRELYFDAKNDTENTPASVSLYMLESLAKRNPASVSFLLDAILNTPDGLPKQAPLPYVVKIHFPGKKAFSHILDPEKSGASKSYDAFRKALVLLKFYDFWCREKLGDFSSMHFTKQQLFEIYRDESDALLLQSGYEPMFAGNPYDWLFLYAAQTVAPLNYFREAIDTILCNTP